MKELRLFFKKISAQFSKFSTREKTLVSAVGVGFVIFIFLNLISFFSEIQDTQQRLVSARRNQLNELITVAQRYTTLSSKKEALQKKFSNSQMTFDQVSIEVDKIINESIGDEKYELTKPNAPSPFGFEFEKQDFKLSIRNINMEQLVKLLYKIENGGKPLYLSKLEINRNSSSTSLAAVLEIYSIGKASGKA